MKIVEILIEYANYSLDRPFSYLYKGDKTIGPGFRVLLSFNHREIIGYVTKVYEEDRSVYEKALNISLFEG